GRGGGQALEAAHLAAAADVPEADDLVGVAAGQVLAVGREGDAVGGADLEDPEVQPVGVGHLHLAVGVTPGGAAAVRGDGRVAARGGRAHLAAAGPALGVVPGQALADADRGYALAVGGERDVRPAVHQQGVAE